MSIASEIERLSGVRSDIFTSITNKGVTVPVGSTFSSCPSLIDQIEGGGGPATSMINPTFTASGYSSGYRPFTATQIVETISAFEDKTESWTSAVTSQADNRILIPVPSSTIKDYWEYNSATHVQSIINFFYTGGQLGTIQMTAYMVPYLTWSPEYPNTFWEGNVEILSNPMSAEIPFNMKSCYDVLANNSASWQWSIQNGIVYIGLQDAWWVIGRNITEMEVSSYYVAVTGTTTAYPYPSYPTTTTGYVESTVSGNEHWRPNQGSTNFTPRIGWSGFRHVVYDDSPENQDIAIGPSEVTKFDFGYGDLKSNCNSYLKLTATSTAYNFSYGPITSAYSGFEGI